MIKLTLPKKPDQLTDEVQRQLTQKFATDGSDVWNKEYIKEPLRNMSGNKCAYSEVQFNRGMSMTLDHFKCKNKYKELVVEWGNLIPCCPYCNSQKGDLDVEIDPIVNPIVDNPKDHLYVKNLRIYGRDEKGKNTIKYVDINNFDHFGKIRSEVALKLTDRLLDLLGEWDSADTTRRKNNRIKQLEAIMNECNKDNEFSALLSCVVLSDDSYKLLKSKIQSDNMWSDALQAKENELREIALPEN